MITGILRPNSILVKLLEGDRNKLFEKEITRNDGSIVSLVTAIQESDGMEGSFKQSVQVGDVVQVGRDVDFVKVGDRAILDYTVDVTSENLAYSESSKDKTVCVSAITTFYSHDYIVPANQKRHHDQYVYREGEIDEASMLIGIIRDEKVIANEPYVILAYKEIRADYKVMKGGILGLSREEKIVERVVISVNNNSVLSEGDVVLVDKDSFFDRNADGKLVSVVYEVDILAVKRKKLILAS